MRTNDRSRLLPVVSSLVLAASIGLADPSAGRADEGPEATRASSAPSCLSSCRGLGVEKVKAGDEHCGFIPRARKDESLDAACRLAESHQEKLQQRADERAREKCADELDRSGCECRTELRRWQNVYTQVFSQRCWTECGWAAVVECEREAASGDEDRDR